MSIEIILRILGWGVPAVAIYAVYELFRRVDKKASGKAKKAVGDWLKGKKYIEIDLSSAVIQVFNYIYGERLLSLSTIFKSITYSVVVYALWTLYLDYHVDVIILYSWIFYGANESIGHSEFKMKLTLASNYIIFLVVSNIISDYLSLFVIRYALRRTLINLPLKLGAAFLASSVVILLFYLIAFISVAAFFGENWISLNMPFDMRFIGNESISLSLGRERVQTLVWLLNHLKIFKFWVLALPAALFVNASPASTARRSGGSTLGGGASSLMRSSPET